MRRARRTEGATVTGGGHRTPRDLVRRPTPLEGVTLDMRVVREEILGPVAAPMTFTDVEDAVAQGNDSEYGSSASARTNDFARTQRTAAGLDVGTVWVNTNGDMSMGTVPSGFKDSGVGRDNGTQVINAYTDPPLSLVSR